MNKTISDLDPRSPYKFSDIPSNHPNPTISLLIPSNLTFYLQKELLLAQITL